MIVSGISDEISADYGCDDGTTRYVYNTSGNLIDTDADGIPDEAENSARLPNTSDDYIAVKLEYDGGAKFHTSIFPTSSV